jgi:hypothetical protein
LDEESGHLRFAFAPGQLQKSARSGQEYEDRRAKVRDPTGEEERDVRPHEIRGVEIQHVAMDEFARVIEQHERHDDAAQQVNGIYAPCCGHRLQATA